MYSIKNLILIFLFLFIGLSSCKKTSNDSYTVNFDLKGVVDSVEVSLHPVTHDRNTPEIAKGTMVNGKLELNGKVTEPTAAYVKLQDGYGLIPIILDNSDIDITGEVYSTPYGNEGMVDYDFSKLNIKGSELTDKYLKIYAIKDSLGQVLSEGRKQFEKINKEYAAARMANDKEKIKEIEDSPNFKELENFDTSFHQKLEKIYYDKIMEGKDSFWGPLTMLTYYVYFIPTMRPIYEAFSEEAKNSTYGQMVKKELYPVGRPGDKLEDFQSVTDNGDSISMFEIAGKNQYTLIDFWASWCKPCRQEIPNLRKLYEKYSDKNFHILSISIDENDEAWRKALDTEQLPWTNCRDTEGDIAKVYGVKSIPMLVVVDSEGKLVIENLRGEELENSLSELFSEN